MIQSFLIFKTLFIVTNKTLCKSVNKSTKDPYTSIYNLIQKNTITLITKKTIPHNWNPNPEYSKPSQKKPSLTKKEVFLTDLNSTAQKYKKYKAITVKEILINVKTMIGYL